MINPSPQIFPCKPRSFSHSLCSPRDLWQNQVSPPNPPPACFRSIRRSIDHICVCLILICLASVTSVLSHASAPFSGPDSISDISLDRRNLDTAPLSRIWTKNEANPDSLTSDGPAYNPFLTFTLQADIAIVNEGDPATTVTVTAQINSGSPYTNVQTLTITVSGTGTSSAVDFLSVPNFDLVVPANTNSASATFTLTLVDDLVDETNETLTIGSTSSLVTGFDTILLQDDDAPPRGVNLRANTNAFYEDLDPEEITIFAEIPGPTTYAIDHVIPVSVTGIQQEGVVGFISVPDFSITLPAGASSASAGFMLRPINNLVDEVNQTLSITSTSSIVIGNTIINLIDDDATPIIILSADPATLNESNGATQVEIRADWDTQIVFPSDQIIPLSIAGSGIASAVDYTSISSINLLIPKGATYGTQSFTLTPIDDSEDEVNERITVRSSSSLVGQAATITLKDNDPAPETIRLFADPSEISEADGATSVVLTAALDGISTFAEPTTISITVSGSGQDDVVQFSSVSSLGILFDPGARIRTTTFILTPFDDNEINLDEEVTLSITNPSLNGSTKIRLLDNDSETIIQLSTDRSSLLESDGPTLITLTASLSGSQTYREDQVIPIAVTGSGVPAAVDFSAVPAFDLILRAGSSTGTATFTLTPLDDLLDESDERITIMSTRESVANSPTITLIDDDETPTIHFSASPSTIRENAGPAEITLTATLNGASQFGTAQSLPVTVRGSGIPAAVDFAAVEDFDLTMDAASSTATATFTLIPENDPEDELDESVRIGSSSPLVTGATTITILDDDDPGAVRLSVTPEVIYEEQGTQSILVTGSLEGDISFPSERIIPLSIRGSDTPGTVDFEPVADIELVFSTNLFTATATFDITPVDDQVFEFDETISISSTDPVVDAPATLRLINDDAAPTGIQLSVEPASILESDGPSSVTIVATVLGGSTYPSDQILIVTAQGSGEASAVDFTPIPDFEMTIAAQSSTLRKVIELIPEDDLIDEQDEVLTFGSTSALVTQFGQLKLMDDDPEPSGVSLSLNPSVISEDAGETEVTVTVRVTGETRYGVDKPLTLSSNPSGLEGAVGFTLTGLSTLTLPAGQEFASATFLVEPADNRLDESDETITITLSGDGLTANAELTLADNDADPGGFELSVTPQMIVEGDGPTVVNVTASIAGDSRYATSQILDLSINEPLAGSVNYEKIPDFTIDVPAGTESGTSSFTLTPVENTLQETDATVTISASHLGVIIQATLMLQDDDQATKRVQDVAAVLLPEATRAIIASSVGSIRERIRAHRYGSSAHTETISHGLSGVAMRFRNESPPGRPPQASWASKFHRTSLATSIKDRITIWARADYRSLSGNSPAYPLNYDGNLSGLHAGVDLSYGQFLVGVFASRFDGDFEYMHRGNTNSSNLVGPVQGQYQINARTFTPYINWSWNAHGSAWALISFGSGEVEIADPEATSENSNTSLQALAAGTDLQLMTTATGFSLALKGAVWGGQMDLDQNSSRIRELDVGVFRLQMSLEGAYRIHLSDQNVLQPFLETGLRRDGGDGQTGTGLEFSGGARLFLSSVGLRISGRGHVLVLHEGNLDEWGVSGMLKYSPGGAYGPAFELRSFTGQRFVRPQEVWQDTRWFTHGQPRMPDTRLESRLGYGFPVDHGSFIPYTAITLGQGAITQIGAEYRIGSQLNIRLEAAQHLQSIVHGNSPMLRALVTLR